MLDYFQKQEIVISQQVIIKINISLKIVKLIKRSNLLQFPLICSADINWFIIFTTHLYLCFRETAACHLLSSFSVVFLPINLILSKIREV